MRDRLKQLRKSLGLTQGELAERIGVGDTAISQIELGRVGLSEQNIKLICLTFGVHEEWLRYGKGEMLDEAAALSDYERQLLELCRRLSPRARRMLLDYAQKLLDDEEALRGADSSSVESDNREVDDASKSIAQAGSRAAS